MSLLREIQADVVNASVDISVVLRKCKVLAARLGNQDFRSWVDNELNGYASKEEIPDYRIIRHVESYGHFVGVGWSQYNNAPIPISIIPKEYQSFLSTIYLTEPITYFSSLIVQQGNQPTLNLGWPGDLVRYLSDKILNGWQLTHAWRTIATSSLVVLVDTVRNRVLNFVIEIEAVAPDAGEASPGEKPIAEDRVKQVFNTYIVGGSAQIAAGNQTIQQDTSITVLQNDFESLKEFLSSLKVDGHDIEDLDAAIKQDKQSRKDTGLGDKVHAWLGKMIGKAESGSWKIATSVAASLLTKALMQYFGLSK